MLRQTLFCKSWKGWKGGGGGGGNRCKQQTRTTKQNDATVFGASSSPLLPYQFSCPFRSHFHLQLCVCQNCKLHYLSFPISFFSVHQLCFPKCVGSECISVCCRVPILSPNEGACFPSFDFWFCIHLLISFIRCKLVQLASATASLRQRTFWWCFVSGGGGGGLPLLIKT